MLPPSAMEFSIFFNYITRKCDETDKSYVSVKHQNFITILQKNQLELTYF